VARPLNDYVPDIERAAAALSSLGESNKRMGEQIARLINRVTALEARVDELEGWVEARQDLKKYLAEL
jgi:predicted nuclease with TOPRIM domain